MAKMRAVDVAMYVLEKEGITTAFGVLGAAINLFYSVMCKHGGICHILACHVEGALHMVEGYTCAMAGNIGVCLGTSGPVGMDMITVLYSASADSIPILCITGQALCACLHKEDFQAVDIEAIAKLVSKMVVTVCEVVLVPRVLQQAFHLMCSGCLGPVLVDLLFDVQVVEIEFDPDMYELLLVYKPAASCMQIEKAVEMLIQAECLVIVAGGGVINADAAALLQQFAELTSVLVIPMLMGWGCILDDHELMAGMVGLQTVHCYGNAMLLVSDMVFGIGNCFANCHTGLVEKYTEGCKIVHIDIELMQIGRVLCLDLGIVSDAKVVLTLLVEVAQEMQKVGCLLCCKEWVADCQQCKCTLLCKTHFDNVLVKLQCVYEEMNKAFGCDVCYVTTIGLSQIAVAQMLHVFKDCHWINCGQAGLLGWMILAVLGVCAADLKCNVVVISGDFDFQFLIEELAVGAQFNILYIHVLVNNAYLGLICQSQRAFDMDYCVQLAFENINSSEVNGYGVDHVKVVEGLGCKAIWVFKLEDIVPAFEQVKALMVQYWVLVVVEVILECVTNILMGSELDNVMEFEDIADNAVDALTETCFMHYE